MSSDEPMNYDDLLFERASDMACLITLALMKPFSSPSDHSAQISARNYMVPAPMVARTALLRDDIGVHVSNPAALEGLAISLLLGGTGSLVLTSEMMEIAYIREDGQPMPVLETRAWGFNGDSVIPVSASELFDSTCTMPDGSIIAPPRGMEFKDAFEI